ncbi:MAG: hypothetical protein ACRDNE_10295 [Gaiellaceae bacterium]
MLRTPSTWLAALLAVAGALVATAVMFADYPFPPEETAFIETPAALLWLLSVAAQWMLWFVLVPALVTALYAHREGFGSSPVLSVAALALLAVGFLLPATFGWPDLPLADLPEYPLTYHRAKIGAIYGVGLLVALTPALGLGLVRARLRGLFRQGKPSATQIQRFLELRESMQHFLFLAGAFVFLAMLSVGALRNAILAQDEALAADFPPEYVLLFGVYFSLLLALAYMPAYAGYLEVGGRMRDALVGPTPPAVGVAELKTWRDERADLESVLRLDVGVGESFRAGFAVFAPLAGSLVSLLLPGVSL